MFDMIHFRVERNRHGNVTIYERVVTPQGLIEKQVALRQWPPAKPWFTPVTTKEAKA